MLQIYPWELRNGFVTAVKNFNYKCFVLYQYLFYCIHAFCVLTTIYHKSTEHARLIKRVLVTSNKIISRQGKALLHILNVANYIFDY